MENIIYTLNCKACGKPLNSDQEYTFSNDLCQECSFAVESELEETE